MTDLRVPAQVQASLPTGGLVPLLVGGGAPVCEGDACFVPGAEGDWSEVPD